MQTQVRLAGALHVEPMLAREEIQLRLTKCALKPSPSTCLQAQLVYEAGQIKGSIAMTHPDRIHASKTGGEQGGGSGSGAGGGGFCHGSVDNKSAAHLLEMVSPSCASRAAEERHQGVASRSCRLLPAHAVS